MGRWIIGDIHGCALTLQSLISKIRETSQDPITLTGDLVDRGPRCREVVQFVIENGFDCVKGNHEDMMVNDILQHSESPHYGDWSKYQGQATLKSYEGFEDQLTSHSIWMKNLPLYIEYPEEKTDKGDYLVVSHSSIGAVWRHRNNPTKKQLFENFALWERFTPQHAVGIYNVFGHTPTESPRVKSFYANVDTGAVFKRPVVANEKPKFGYMTALHFPSMKIVTQENIDV